MHEGTELLVINIAVQSVSPWQESRPARYLHHRFVLKQRSVNITGEWFTQHEVSITASHEYLAALPGKANTERTRSASGASSSSPTQASKKSPRIA